MNNKKTKALAHGAICAALSVILMCLAYYLPFFSTVSVLFAGLPMVFLGTRYGGKIAAISAMAAILVLPMLMGNILSALLLGVLNLLPGVVIGYGIAHRKRYLTVLAFASGAILIGLVLQILLLNSMTADGNGIAAILDEIVAGAKTMMGQMIDGLGEAEKQQLLPVTDTLYQAMDMVKVAFLLYLPTILIAMATALGYGSMATGIFMLRRLKIRRVNYLPFSMIQASRGVCYLSVILSLFTSFSVSTAPMAVGMRNMAALLDCFLAVCGLSLIDNKLSRKVASGYARTGIYAAVFVIGYVLIGFISQALIFLGLLDGMMDFRRSYKVGEGYGKDE